jgi:hypothetical protein
VKDYREVVITDLADENGWLRERVASLEADVAVYRELAIAAMDALREVTVRNQALEPTNARLRDEVKAYRENALLRAGAEDDHEAAA